MYSVHAVQSMHLSAAALACSLRYLATVAPSGRACGRAAAAPTLQTRAPCQAGGPHLPAYSSSSQTAGRLINWPMLHCGCIAAGMHPALTVSVVLWLQLL